MSSPTIVLIVVGDTMIGRSFNEKFDDNPYHNPWGDTKKVLDTGHLVLANLETTLSNGNERIPNKPGGFYFHLRPEYAGVLRDAGIDYVSLGNNHILDYQTAGFNETIETLEQLNISYSGAGLNLNEARKPAVYKIRTIPNNAPKKYNRIAIFSAADHYLDWAATKNRPGTWIIDHARLSDALAFFEGYRQRHPKTFIILCYHWGANYEPDIPTWKRELATKLFRSGVDLILGHSPHHIESYEKIDGKYVFYSLGDFIDDYMIDEHYRNDIGMIGRLTIDLGVGSITNVETYLTHIDGMQVNLV